MISVSFSYAAPERLDEAVALLRENSEVKILAGGQSLLNNMKLRHMTPSALVDLRNIQALHTIELQEDKRLRIGAMVTFTQIAENKTCQEYYPALVDAVNSTSSRAIRNLSTVGGNLAQRDIGADLPATLLALDATINFFGPRGSQALSCDELCTGQTALSNDEIITSIDLPAAVAGSISAYTKLRNRATGNALCGVAASVILTIDSTVSTCRIAATGLTQYTVRLSSVEQALLGKRLTNEVIAAIEWTSSEYELITDLVSSAEYRAYMTNVLTRRVMSQVVARTNQ